MGVDLDGMYAIDKESINTSRQERSSTRRLIISLYTEKGYVECGRTDSSEGHKLDVIREVLCAEITVASKIKIYSSSKYHIRMCEVEVNALL